MRSGQAYNSESEYSDEPLPSAHAFGLGAGVPPPQQSHQQQYGAGMAPGVAGRTRVLVPPVCHVLTRSAHLGGRAVGRKPTRAELMFHMQGGEGEPPPNSTAMPRKVQAQVVCCCTGAVTFLSARCL